MKGTYVMSETNSVVAIYESHSQAEEAVKELQRSGFDMKKMSIVGKDYHSDEHVVGYYNTGDRMKYWGKMGAFWGGVWGWLFGAAFFAIPGIGHMPSGGSAEIRGRQGPQDQEGPRLFATRLGYRRGGLLKDSTTDLIGGTIRRDNFCHGAFIEIAWWRNVYRA
jgi:hypothetical protein